MKILRLFIIKNFPFFQKATYDSGFVDTSDENNDLARVKQGIHEQIVHDEFCFFSD